jgi:hypothetical protein
LQVAVGALETLDDLGMVLVGHGLSPGGRMPVILLAGYLLSPRVDRQKSLTPGNTGTK